MTEGPASVRSAVAIAAGFFADAVLPLVGDAAFRALAPEAFDDRGFVRDGANLLVVLAYLAIFECVGGFITARLAIRSPLKHALALGILVLALSLALTVFTWGSAPAWYQIAALAIIVPMSLAGGKLAGLVRPRDA